MQKPFATILVLACSLGLLAGCQTHRAASVPMAMPATSIELRMPRPDLYTAGQPAADDWAAIAARGVGSVIDLRAPGELKDRDEAAEVRSAGMRYVAIPVAGADGITDGNARLLRDALAAARGPVLVHCASGNRAGGLLALSEARYGGAAPEQAIALGRKAGMASTEARVRELLAAPDVRCVVQTGGSARPEGCP